MKLNIGSGPRDIPGFINMDVLPWYTNIGTRNTDIIHDITKVPYPIESNSVEEILMVEVLEHISFHSTVKVLKELHRILVPQGKATIQVPDCGKMMLYYANNQVCDCVKGRDSEGNPGCKNCAGKAKINKERWFYSMVGQQKHKYDAHLNMFTKENLTQSLNQAGFTGLEFRDHPHKLLVIIRT